eukprot:s1140_g5.t1
MFRVLNQSLYEIEWNLCARAVRESVTIFCTRIQSFPSFTWPRNSIVGQHMATPYEFFSFALAGPPAPVKSLWPGWARRRDDKTLGVAVVLASFHSAVVVRIQELSAMLQLQVYPYVSVHTTRKSAMLSLTAH